MGKVVDMDEEENLFFAVCLPPDENLKGKDKNEEEAHVYVRREEALKFCKQHPGARFKVFTKRKDAIDFSKSSVQKIENSGPDALGEKLPFSSLKPQELTNLRKAIEKGDKELFLKLVWGNPRYLISSGDSATPLKQGQRYNALHVAAMQNQPEMCKVILETVSDPEFVALLYPDDKEEVRDDRVKCLLDSYLNTADPARNETPLHFASKFGAVECAEVLVSYPQCHRDRKNKENQTPAEVACSRKMGSPEAKTKIEFLLGERFFVPIYRAADNSVQPVIAQPWSPDSKDASIVQSPILDDDLDVSITAYAGPMSHEEADTFYKKLKTPIRRLLRLSSSESQSPASSPAHSSDEARLVDAEKGVETQGRELAKNAKVPWREYWPFINELCDLSSNEGLGKFENYLRKARNEQENEIENFNPLSPVSDLCLQFQKLSVKPILDDEDEFVTPPSSPTLGFATPPYEEPIRVYINGNFLSKADVDAYFALRNTEIDFLRFPNVASWKETMLRHGEEELKRIKYSNREKTRHLNYDSAKKVVFEKTSSPVPPLLQGIMSPTKRPTTRSPFRFSSPFAVRLSDRFENLHL